MTEFTDEEVDVIRDMIRDWGSDCPDTDYDKVRLLAEKLGVWEPKKPPTPEELERAAKLAASSGWKQYSDMLKSLSERTALAWLMAPQPLLFVHSVDAVDASANCDLTTGKIGSILRIRLPQDYEVTGK